MGWREDGTVQRVNPDFAGNAVWQQDQSVPINIVAARQDFHDEDLARAIANTLHIGGDDGNLIRSFNKMKADLKMGGFKVVNVAKAELPAEAVRFDQTIQSANFDDPSRNLTMPIVNGQDVVVNIPAGEGGETEGTVFRVGIGDGLTASEGADIILSSDLVLDTVFAGQTITNGLASLTINKHGMITAAEGDAYLPVNLAVGTRAADQLEITSSRGSNADLPLATNSLAGIASEENKKTLNDLPSNLHYSRGTFTLEPTFGGATPDSDNKGYYVRIGDLVLVWGNVSWSVASNTSSSAFQWDSMPFQPANPGFFNDQLMPVNPWLLKIGYSSGAVGSETDPDLALWTAFPLSHVLASALAFSNLFASNTSGGGIPAGFENVVSYNQLGTTGAGNWRFYGAYITDD